MAQHKVPLAAVSPEARVRLQEASDLKVAQQAAQLFRSDQGQRASVVLEFQDVARFSGHGGRGRKVFDDHCARCHLPGRHGAQLGPDLSGVSNKSRQELLLSILDPSGTVDPRFTNYIVTTKDGRIFDGIIAHETPTAVVMRGSSDNGDVTVPRKHIAEIRASTISVMPERLKESVSRQDLADLIAYLRAGL